MLSIIMLNVVMLGVVILNIVVPIMDFINFSRCTREKTLKAHHHVKNKKNEIGWLQLSLNKATTKLRKLFSLNSGC